MGRGEWFRSGVPAFVVRLSRVFGVAPIVVESNGVRISRPLVHYGRIIITIMQIFGISSILVLTSPLNSWSRAEHKSATLIIWILQRFVITVAVFFGGYLAPYHMKNWIEIIDRVEKINRKFDGQHCKAESKRTEKITMAVWCICLVLVSILDFYFYGDEFGLEQSEYTLYTNRNINPSPKNSITITQITAIYIDICELVDVMNDRNGFIVVLLILNSCMHLTVSAYNSAVLFVATPMSISLVVTELLWCLYNAFNICVLISPGHTIICAVQRIRLITSKFMGRTKGGNDEVFVGLRRLFITLMLNNPTFTPFETLTMSRKLIVSIFITVSTYLAFLIQFQNV